MAASTEPDMTTLLGRVGGGAGGGVGGSRQPQAPRPRPLGVVTVHPSTCVPNGGGGGERQLQGAWAACEIRADETMVRLDGAAAGRVYVGDRGVLGFVMDVELEVEAWMAGAEDAAQLRAMRGAADAAAAAHAHRFGLGMNRADANNDEGDEDGDDEDADDEDATPHASSASDSSAEADDASGSAAAFSITADDVADARPPHMNAFDEDDWEPSFPGGSESSSSSSAPPTPITAAVGAGASAGSGSGSGTPTAHARLSHSNMWL